ncbi:MAG: bifunctional glutamine-synthetase adenylyltransferase/deadenyltransferase, partial [Bifidobacterium sp.]|nr:bifunctional glutamine-synthetase adenylyltransferase/deadenyltransferase [Bifidobacterium sp.]
MGTMASSTHQFGVLDLIRAGLQDLDTARTLLDELRADGIDDDRLCLLMKTLEQTCEPDIALRNLVDIIKALQSQGRDFHQVITDDAGLVRLVTVLGVSDGMGKLMRFRPELVMAAASDSCESHLYNHAQRRAHVLEAVGADPADNRMPKATKPLAEAATALRQTYRKQLAAIMAQD